MTVIEYFSANSGLAPALPDFPAFCGKGRDRTVEGKVLEVLDTLKNSNKAVGIKQSLKAVANGNASLYS